MSLTTLSVRQVRRVISQVYKRRDNLAQTLTNANSIAESLTNTMAIFLRVLLLFGMLWTMDVDVSSLWISFSSSLVALAFVFGGVMREYFESAVFLFSVHPYDVGDWIVIGELLRAEIIRSEFGLRIASLLARMRASCCSEERTHTCSWCCNLCFRWQLVLRETH